MKNEDKQVKVLWLIPKWTFPVNDGARVATDSLIRNTVKAGAQVDVLCLAQKEEKVNTDEMLRQWGVKKVKVLRRPLPTGRITKYFYYLKNFLIRPHIPLTFSSFYDAKIRQQVHKVMANNNYDYILLDGLHLGAAILDSDFKSLTRAKVIYRAHNIEADLWKKAFKDKKGILLKTFLYHQSRAVEKLEFKIISQADAVAPIASEDLAFLNIVLPNRPYKHVPLGLSFRTIDLKFNAPLKFLFIGRLDWPPNRDGLEWILREVWPEVQRRRKQAILKIVGSGDKAWLNSYKYLPGLEICGQVEKVEEAYEDCHFTLVPIKYGSGTRIKVLESFAMGRPLISTSMGIQGAGLLPQDYIHAETREEWIKILGHISPTHERLDQLKESCSRLAQAYCEKKVALEFYSWLRTV